VVPSRGLLALVFILLLATATAVGIQQLRKSGSFLPDLALPDIAISTPGPLRGSTDAPVRHLTAEGILRETNRHRAEANLPPLTLNAKLSSAAQAKVSDMFRQQYFEHVGPDGRGPSDWVEDAGYAYLAVGENLALGNFDNDAALVQAWMNSPGHRANILNTSFKEIGLAATAGTFEGSRTWLAVQEFGTPASACPTPTTTLRTQYEQKEAELENLQNEINATKAEIDRLVAEHDRKVSEGNAKIEEGNEAARKGDRETAEARWAEGEALHGEARQLEDDIRERERAYNALVDQHNTLRQELVELSRQLNAQIDAYNACVGAL
jgi:hypothetical protein